MANLTDKMKRVKLFARLNLCVYYTCTLVENHSHNYIKLKILWKGKFSVGYDKNSWRGDHKRGWLYKLSHIHVHCHLLTMHAGSTNITFHHNLAVHFPSVNSHPQRMHRGCKLCHRRGFLINATFTLSEVNQAHSHTVRHHEQATVFCCYLYCTFLRCIQLWSIR